MSEVDPLDLSNLQMLPDWVKQPQETPKFKEEPVRKPGGGKGHGKGGRGGPPRGRRDDNRRSGGGPRRDNNQRGGKRFDQRDKRGGGRGGKGGKGRGGPRDDRDRRAPQDHVPKGVSLIFQPARDGVAFIAQQIKTSGCAYPVFDLARLILNNRDRYNLVFESKGDTKLFHCKLDHSLWMSRDEAVGHATTCKEFGDYYKEEMVTVDPPKGNFSSIAVCGLSGELLGPPNHHSYQENIVRVHAERFPRMHIDGYRRKIKVERDEEIVEKWKEQQSTQAHFTLLKTKEGEEPTVFKSRQEAARHFSQNFADGLIQEVKKATLPGDISGKHLARPIFNLLRQEGERLRKFPMDLVQRLCRAFEKQGLKFFKEGKKTTDVARLRPRQITDEGGFSDGIRRIVSYIRSHPNTKLNDLAGAMIPESKRSAPLPQPKKKPKRRRRTKKPKNRASLRGPFTIWTRKPEPEIEEPTQEAPKEPESNSPAAGEQRPATPVTKAFTIWTQSQAPQSPSEQPPSAAPEPAAAPALTPEEIAVLQDLRWLIREGYVIEFSNGTLKLPRSPEPAKKKQPKKKAASSSPPGAKAESPDASAVRNPNPTPTTPPPSGSTPRAAASPTTTDQAPPDSPPEPPARKPDPTPTSAPPGA